VDPGSNGIAQMQHFTTADKLNAYRLPIGWQYLVKSQLGGALDSTILAAYDKLVQGCLATGALCIIDLHNYARWNGAVVGQGGPTNAQFADVWSKIAAKYKSEKNIAFGLMNEPHDLTMSTWATSVQAAVTAIRKAGATLRIRMALLASSSSTCIATWTPTTVAHTQSAPLTTSRTRLPHSLRGCAPTDARLLFPKLVVVTLLLVSSTYAVPLLRSTRTATSTSDTSAGQLAPSTPLTYSL
jgi:hypothetical protein